MERQKSTTVNHENMIFLFQEGNIMANKVLKVDMIGGTATVGDEQAQTMKEYSLDDFNYTPNVGDMVNIFKDENNKTMIILASASAGPKTAPAYAPSYSDASHSATVNKTAYALLAFFLGQLGIHHFYAGDSARGLKYLLLSTLLCWTFFVPVVLWIKAIIQAVNVLNMPGDENGNVVLYHQ